MSATDSDNSIDWLASDYEDNESEQEFDSNGKCSQKGAPLSPPGRPHLEPTDGSRQVKDCENQWSEVGKASSQGSTPSCVEKWDSNSGLCRRQQSEKPPPQQALKRPCSSVGEERRERQLLSNESEKNQIFSRKVSAASAHLVSNRGRKYTARAPRSLLLHNHLSSVSIAASAELVILFQKNSDSFDQKSNWLNQQDTGREVGWRVSSHQNHVEQLSY